MVLANVLAVPVAALMAFTLLSSPDPSTDASSIDGDAHQVSHQVYREGDAIIDETVFEFHGELPAGKEIVFDDDVNTGLPFPKS